MALAHIPSSAVADTYDADNYLPTDTSVVLSETNLPIVFIDTKALTGSTAVIHKDYRTAVRMTVIDNGDGRNYADTLAHSGQTIDYSGWVGVKWRGVSSFIYSKKKPIGFKTLETSNVNGKKEKVQLLGMPKDNDWVLLAPYHDRSMIRDILTFELARPYFEYTPRGRFCELIMDGIYRGVYILCEKPGKGKNRLDLEAPGNEGDAATGDYLLEIDGNDEPHYYTSKYKARFESGANLPINAKIYIQYKYPEYDDMTGSNASQLEYINKRLADMEDALNGKDFANLDTGYRRYIDMTSFIDNMLTQEFTGNPDGYRRSTYLYKRRDSIDGRFKMCLWDFNLAYGGSLQEVVEANAWHYTNKSGLYILRPFNIPFWWTRLMEDSDYRDSLKRRWAEYRTGNYTREHVTHVIDSLVNILCVGGACERNYKAWPNWDEDIFLDINATKSYDEEIAYLRSWIDRRISWLDKRLGVEGQDTGIADRCKDGTEEAAPEGDSWYDLQGRRLEAMPKRKGLYINGRRKMVRR